MGNELTTFVTWETLAGFSTLIAVVFVVTEFTKEIGLLKKIKTKYYSAVVAFVLIFLTNIHFANFNYLDIVLYVLSAIVVSMSSNGISDFSKTSVRSR